MTAASAETGEIPAVPAASGRPSRVRPVLAATGRRLRGRIRLVLASALVVVGAVALALGWYGVSGQALVAKQLPYLVSGGLLGVALVILAAVLFGADIVQRELGRLERVERLVDDLHGALLQASAATPAVAGAPAVGTLVALPSGVTYHREDCSLVAGKSAATPVDAAERARRGLRPCRVCRPDAPAA